MNTGFARSVRAWCAFALVAFAPVWAGAVGPPEPYTVQLGPLGPLTISGGADGYAYALSGAGNDTDKGLLGTSMSAGAEFLNGLVKVEKPGGLVQFTVEAGAVNSLTLGSRPKDPTVQKWSTGPVRTAIITLAPTPNLTISAGQIGSLEGYESAIDWKNFNMLLTSLWDVENAQSVGVSARYRHGPASITAIFSDGFDTNVWNYLQVAGSYSFNDNNVLTLFGATNLGATGLGARFYGSATRPYTQTTVGISGAANFVNSSVIGGYYEFVVGNLELVPEVQYVWANKNTKVGVSDFSSNFGAALFVNYSFKGTAFSLGGWMEYFSSNGPDAWFLNAGSQGVGFVVGPTWSPTWAKKHLFVRSDVGLIHLTNIRNPGSVGYGSLGSGRNQATFVVEGGVLF